MDSKERKKFQQTKLEIMKRAQQDPAFKKKLKSHPHEVFKEYGFNLPKKIEINVCENTPTTLNFVIPLEDTGELRELHAAWQQCEYRVC